MTVRELKDYLKDCPDDLPVVIFDNSEGEYLGIGVYRDIISQYGSWTRYTADVIVIDPIPKQQF